MASLDATQLDAAVMKFEETLVAGGLADQLQQRSQALEAVSSPIALTMPNPILIQRYFHFRSTNPEFPDIEYV